MILAEKLYQLRTKSGLSQEELAEKLNVSRQSISKWESANSIPSMDKIVQLSKIYGVSTDYLLKDEMEEIPGEIVPDLTDQKPAREVKMEEIREYQKLVRAGNTKYAIGVMLCIWSVVPLMILEGLAADGRLQENTADNLGVILILVIVAVAVGIIVMASSGLHKYDFLDDENFSLEYGAEDILRKEMEELQPVCQKKKAAGRMLCILSVVPLLVSGIYEEKEALSYYGVAIMLMMVGIAVYLFKSSSREMNIYRRLLQIDDFAPDQKKIDQKLSTFASVYWEVMTAVYLIWSFITNDWGFTWVIWPVGAILYAAVYAILSAVAAKNLR